MHQESIQMFISQGIRKAPKQTYAYVGFELTRWLYIEGLLAIFSETLRITISFYDGVISGSSKDIS